MKKSIKFIIKILISLVILSFLFYKLDFSQIKNSILAINIMYLVFGLFIVLISLIFMVLKWSLFIRKFSNASLVRLYFIYWASDFMSLFGLGSLGSESYKMIAFKEKKKALAYSLIDKGYSFVWYLILSLSFGLFYLFFGKFSYLLIFPVISVYFFLVLIFISFDINIKKTIINWNLSSKLGKIFRFSSLEKINLIKHSIASLFYVVMLYFLYSIIMFAVGIQIRIEFLFFIPLLIILLTLPISIQGLGVREFVLITYAKSYGLDLELALASAILIFVVGLIYRILGVIPFLILKNRN